MPVCPVLPFSPDFLFSALIFAVQPLSTSGTPYCSSYLSRAQLGFLPPPPLHLWFTICHRTAIMGKGLLIHLWFAAMARGPSPEQQPPPDLGDQRSKAERDHGPGAGGTLAVLRHLFLERDEEQQGHQRWRLGRHQSHETMKCIYPTAFP